MTPEKLAELDQFRAQALATTGPAFATGPSFNSSNGTSPPAGAIAVGASVMAGPVAGDPVEQLGNLEGGEEQMTMAGAPAQSGSGARAETGGGEVTGGTSRKRSQTQDNEQHNVERRSKRPVVQGRGADAPRAPAPASGRSQRVVNQQGGSMGVGPSLRRSRRLQELQEGIGGAPSSSTTAGATSRKRTQRTEEAELQHKRPRKGGGGAVEASRVVPRGGRATARRTVNANPMYPACCMHLRCTTAHSFLVASFFQMNGGYS